MPGFCNPGESLIIKCNHYDGRLYVTETAHDLNYDLDQYLKGLRTPADG